MIHLNALWMDDNHLFFFETIFIVHNTRKKKHTHIYDVRTYDMYQTLFRYMSPNITVTIGMVMNGFLFATEYCCMMYLHTSRAFQKIRFYWKCFRLYEYEHNIFKWWIEWKILETEVAYIIIPSASPSQQQASSSKPMPIFRSDIT